MNTKKETKAEKLISTIDTLGSNCHTDKDSCEIEKIWTDSFALNNLIRSLSELEKTYPYTYKRFTKVHKETISKSKTLIAKLKLQNLPLPWIEVTYSNSLFCGKEAFKYRTCVSDEQCSIYRYLYATRVNDSIAQVETQIRQYHNEVEPVLKDVYSILKSITYRQLVKVYDNFSEKSL